jgi:hypothetical protein
MENLHSIEINDEFSTLVEESSEIHGSRKLR